MALAAENNRAANGTGEPAGKKARVVGHISHIERQDFLEHQIGIENIRKAVVKPSDCIGHIILFRQQFGRLDRPGHVLLQDACAGKCGASLIGPFMWPDQAQ